MDWTEGPLSSTTTVALRRMSLTGAETGMSTWSMGWLVVE